MKKIWVLISAVTAVTLTGCGSQEQTTGLKVTVAGHSDWVDNAWAGLERCSYFDGWLSAGDHVLLRDSEGEIMGVSELQAAKDFHDSPTGPGEATVVCSWEANFEDVSVNRDAYTLRLGEFGEAVVSRESIAQGEVKLQPRSAMSVLAGDGVLAQVE